MASTQPIYDDLARVTINNLVENQLENWIYQGLRQTPFSKGGLFEADAKLVASVVVDEVRKHPEKLNELMRGIVEGGQYD